MTSLSVTWGHVTSFPVTWLPPHASYNLLWYQTHSVCRFRPSTATSRWLPVKWRHFQVTSDHLRSRDVISCHVTVSSCELQPCMKSSTQCMTVFGLLQPLPGDFRSNDVTFGHFRPPEFMWHHFLLRDWFLLRATAFVWSQTHSVRQFCAFYSHFQVTSGEMTSLPVTSGHLSSCDVISSHETASCELQPCIKSNTQCTLVFGLLQPLPGDFRSIDVTSDHFRSTEVARHHFLSRDCVLLRETAL